MYDLIIAGGGASGMTAAIKAAEKAKDKKLNILIIEKNKKLGKKLYATGNGKCNLGNTFLDLSCYSSDQEFFPFEVINTESYKSICRFYEELGINITDKDGYLYPSSMQASAVVWAMVDRIKELGIQLNYNETFIDFEAESNTYRVLTDKSSYETKCLILALGSPSAPKLGGNMEIYKHLHSKNINVIDVRPSLAKLFVKENIEDLSGVRTKAKAKLYIDDTFISEEEGELQFAHASLSGILIFNLNPLIKDFKSNVRINIELLPDLTREDLIIKLSKGISIHKSRSLMGILNGFINEKISKYIIDDLKLNNVPVSMLKNDDIETIADCIKNLEFYITDYASYDESQGSLGGIDTKQINPATMELKPYDNIFVTGEYMDVLGKCGGYNLMWAVITGTLAGENAADKI